MVAASCKTHFVTIGLTRPTSDELRPLLDSGHRAELLLRA